MKEFRNKLIKQCSSAKGMFNLTKAWAQCQKLDEPPDRASFLADFLKDVDSGQDLLDSWNDKGISCVVIGDDQYPSILEKIAQPPWVLFYSGQAKVMHKLGISIVGARQCTRYGLQMARWISGEFARLGISIVSGLALGIDGQAHQAALDVGGSTLAVLGSGLDVLYPKGHRALARSIIHYGGLIVSEFPPGTSPQPQHFPYRNRIISGLSQMVIVVEAKLRSGSLTTARHALDQGKMVFGVPGPLKRPTGEGVHRLVASGEAQILVGLEDILAELGPHIREAVHFKGSIEQLIPDPICRKIYRLLDPFEPTTLNDLMRECSIQIGTILASMVVLESESLAESVPGLGYFRNPLTLIQE